MPEHIRRHSEAVARVARDIATYAIERELSVHMGALYASALLHDIAKIYTVQHGGDHAQLGAAWCMQELENPYIAQGIMHHVWWPWEVVLDTYFLPIVILYADKRVCHDRIVTLTERYDDLLVRYGVTEASRRYILRSMKQAKAIECALSARLEIDFDAYSFDSRWLVQ